MKRLAKNKHSSLLDPFVSYEEYEVFEYVPGASQHIIFFVTYSWAQWFRVLHQPSMESLYRHKHSSLLDLFIGFEENEVL
jgi:hypothetical protein